MSKHERGFLERGQTWYAGATIDTANPDGVNMEGKEFEFEDLNYAATNLAKPYRVKGAMCIVRLVRNVSGIALLPRRLVRLIKTDTTNLYGRTDGYARLITDTPCYPLDEFLPSAGLPNYDMGYIVIKGPSECLTALEASADNLIAVGDILVALTAATTGATTAGRLAQQDLTGATAVLGNNVQHRIGRALSAKTTANTGVAILVLIGKD